MRKVPYQGSGKVQGRFREGSGKVPDEEGAVSRSPAPPTPPTHPPQSHSLRVEPLSKSGRRRLQMWLQMW